MLFKDFEPIMKKIIFTIVILNFFTCSMNPNIISDIRTLKEAGFFESYGSIAPIEIARKINKEFEYRSYYTKNSLDKNALARLDSTKYIDIYPEITVCSDCEFYSKLVKRFSKISEGKFLPIEISENWETKSGPIILKYSIDNQIVTLHPKLDSDWLDYEILDHLKNELSVREVKLKKLDQSDGALLRINDEHEDILYKNFGWTFK